MAEITVASTTDTQEAVEQAAGFNDGGNSQVIPQNGPADHDQETQPETTAPEDDEGAVSGREQEAPDTDNRESKQNERTAKGKSGRRIDKLARRVHEQQEELDALRDRVARATGPRPEGQRPAPIQGDSRPVPTNYQSYDAYVEALADWKAGQHLQQQKQMEAAQAEQQRAREVFDIYNEAAKSARVKYDDFEEVVGRRDLKIPQAAQIAIIEAGEAGPDIAYYLGKHPDACQELAKMSPMRAIARIGQIESQVTGEREQVAGERLQVADAAQQGTSGPRNSSSTRTKIATSAPAPISPVGGSHKTMVPLGELPYRDYKRLRDQEERAQRR